MDNTFYFRNTSDEFYLRFEDDILYFKEKEHNIFSALDLYKVLVNGKINTITISTYRFKVIDFINKYITYDRLVILDKDKLLYHNDSKFLYVDLNDHEVNIDGGKITVEYLSIDSDRHNEKEKLVLTIDKKEGIYIYNSKYLLYIHKSLFSKYQIKNV